jgi:hypothetical protein
VARGFECTFVELDAIGDALRLDVRPFPFQFPVHGELVDERIELIKKAHGTLTAKGLIEGRRFSPDLEDAVGVFARGDVAIALIGTVDGEGVCARAATNGRFAVLARQRGAAVRFDQVSPRSLVRSVLALLPPARPGPGRSVTVTVDDPEPAGRHRVSPEEDFASRRYLQPVRPISSAGSLATEIMRRPRLGSGYFAVTARGRNGREGEPLTMSWLDTDGGRYAVLPSTGPDGRLHVTYTPAELARLDQSLSRLVQLMS